MLIATQESEETATAFTVSKTSHNSRTKHYFANPRMKTWLEAYRNFYLHFIDPSAAVAVYTNTLPYTSLAHAHRGIITYSYPAY